MLSECVTAPSRISATFLIAVGFAVPMSMPRF